jgi:hypothetical protein
MIVTKTARKRVMNIFRFRTILEWVLKRQIKGLSSIGIFCGAMQDFWGHSETGGSEKSADPNIPSSPSNLGNKTEIIRLCSIPDHQQGIRCEAPKSED